MIVKTSELQKCPGLKKRDKTQTNLNQRINSGSTLPLTMVNKLLNVLRTFKIPRKWGRKFLPRFSTSRLNKFLNSMLTKLLKNGMMGKSKGMKLMLQENKKMKLSEKKSRRDRKTKEF